VPSGEAIAFMDFEMMLRFLQRLASGQMIKTTQVICRKYPDNRVSLPFF